MAVRQDPIVGKYAYVPYGGREYRVFYEEAGEGIPLVCLHTAGTDSREWRHQLSDPEINSNFRVIAFDLPRHGKSIPPLGFEREEYRLTAKFYSEFVMAFCDALELERPVVMGSSMGGNICLHLALNFEERLRALIAIEACDYSPGWFISWLHHPEVHGGEACATSVFGLMAPQSPSDYRWETWWYYSQGGPGIFKGDLYFYSVDHDFRELNERISGAVPIYFMTGVYDFACTPEMTSQTAEKIKGSETIIMEGIGHFPMSENPVTFKKYLMPVLDKIRGAAAGAGKEAAGAATGR
jgi:pimeloyl-ACP methyl ester carboxylesterase